ncbi:MAG: MFS transporter [Pirellulaceae bacterium]
MTTRLSIMMFLQFFAWGAWFATLGLALGSNGFGPAVIGGAYESAPIAAIFAPLFLGLIADRFFASEKVFGVLMLIGGGIMIALTQFAQPENSQTMIWLMIAYMCCYMPTLGLGNSIAFTHIPDQSHFPKIRVWGTIGWIVAGLGLGFAGWSASLNIFWLGAVSSVLLGLYCFTLPHTPPPAKDSPLNWRSLLMLDAFGMMKSPGFLVFAVCSTLICIPLGYYYGQTSVYLGAAGFTEAGSTMTLGQMSEIFFMLLIPFFFRKLGVKLMLLIGMGSWVVRYLLFAFGAPDQITWMLLLGVALHGICYDFFFVTGFMYTDNKAPKEIRGQAQSLLVFLTQGIGLFFGFRFAFGGNWPFTTVPLPNKIGEYGPVPGGALAEEIKTLNEGAPARSTMDSLLAMFDKGYPDDLSYERFVVPAMAEWRNYWIYPAILAAAVFVLFAVGFWDRMTPAEKEEATA